jgi:hypothetical protein
VSQTLGFGEVLEEPLGLLHAELAAVLAAGRDGSFGGVEDDARSLMSRIWETHEVTVLLATVLDYPPGPLVGLDLADDPFGSLNVLEVFHSLARPKRPRA